MKNISLTASIMVSLFSNSLFAMETFVVYNPQDIAMFEVRFFDRGDGPFMDAWPAPRQSTWDLNQLQKTKILAAINYWAEIITPLPGALPAIINVGTFNAFNAAGFSPSVTDGVNSVTQLQGALNGIDVDDLSFDSHAQFVMGKMDFDNVAYLPSQLPRTGDTDVFSVAAHELAHGLGISNMADDVNGQFTPAFFDDFPFGAWTASLRDDNGNPARPGQVILCRGCNNPWDPKGFDVRNDKGYFTGENVNEVLAGAMPGIPVKMLSDYGDVDSDYMSHIELKNSMMSHQEYRNYTTFMEAELALLQDLGYQIDRRKFFGFSLYGDGKTLFNQHGYFLRDGANGLYKNGEYNTATLGVGLHVYGSYNQIYQQADLLTSGAGGAGIRIDGQSNTLFIEPGVQVHANGINGRGVMFAYGKNHNFIQRGDVQALGINGIAINFDFGNNMLGNDSDYRGSWIHNVDGYKQALLPELKGALVDSADISGQVAGKDAAIYISSNALVNHINILNGAKIVGDIYSDYSQRDALGQQRLTDLSFGWLADRNGHASGKPDPGFRFDYRGNISGIDNLVLNARSGTTSVTGSHKLYGLYIAPDATLAGYSDYTLNPEGIFINEGKLIPGNSLEQMSIAGRYQQRDTGELRLGIDGRGRHDTLKIDDHAEFNGKLTLVPQRDWYAPAWHIESGDLLKTTSHSGQFNEISGLFRSPVLSLITVPKKEGEWELQMRRAPDAYSRYARDRNESNTGKALDAIVNQAKPPAQDLFRTLDFSAPDGQEIGKALRQLSPAAWSAMFAASLHREQQIANIISESYSMTSPEREWQSFAIPFSGSVWQQRQDYRTGYGAKNYGLIFGADKKNTIYDGWVMGFHGAIGGQTVTMRAPDSGTGKSTAFNIGLQARYGVERQEGGYLFGNARVGVEKGWLKRRVAVGDYMANHQAHWTGKTGSVMTGGGYRFAVSENMTTGPIVSLNYTTLYRPDITENGNEGSRLKLDSATFHSLQSGIGVKSSGKRALSSGGVLSTAIQLTWEHELLDNNLSQTAGFADYGSARFSQRNKVAGHNALGVKTGMGYQVNNNVELGASVNSELFNAGYHSLSGNLTVNWRF